MTGSQSFAKEERLTDKRTIEELFKSGKVFTLQPFRVLYSTGKRIADYPLTVMFAVPGKNFSKAVDRNRIRRLMREAYRRNKSDILLKLKEAGQNFSMILLYTGKTIAPYKEIEHKIILILQRLYKENEQSVQ